MLWTIILGLAFRNSLNMTCGHGISILPHPGMSFLHHSKIGVKCNIHAGALAVSYTSQLRRSPVQSCSQVTICVEFLSMRSLCPPPPPVSLIQFNNDFMCPNYALIRYSANVALTHTYWGKQCFSCLWYLTACLIHHPLFVYLILNLSSSVCSGCMERWRLQLGALFFYHRKHTFL